MRFDVFARVTFASLAEGRRTKMSFIFWVAFDRSQSAKLVRVCVLKTCLRAF